MLINVLLIKKSVIVNCAPWLMSTVPFRLLSFIEFQEAIGKILHFIKKTQVLLIFLMMALMADTQVCKKTV